MEKHVYCFGTRNFFSSSVVMKSLRIEVCNICVSFSLEPEPLLNLSSQSLFMEMHNKPEICVYSEQTIMCLAVLIIVTID